MLLIMVGAGTMYIWGFLEVQTVPYGALSQLKFLLQ